MTRLRNHIFVQNQSLFSVTILTRVKLYNMID